MVTVVVAVSVAVGATAALSAVAGLAVVSGQRLMKRVSVRRVRQFTGLVLMILAIVSATATIHGWNAACCPRNDRSRSALGQRRRPPVRGSEGMVNVGGFEDRLRSRPMTGSSQSDSARATAMRASGTSLIVS